MIINPETVIVDNSTIPDLSNVVDIPVPPIINKEKKHKIYLLSDLNYNCRFIKVFISEESSFEQIKKFFSDNNCDLAIKEYDGFDDLKNNEYNFILNKNLFIEDITEIKILVDEHYKANEIKQKLDSIKLNINAIESKIGLANKSDKLDLPFKRLVTTNRFDDYANFISPVSGRDDNKSRDIRPLPGVIKSQSELTGEYTTTSINGFPANSSNYALISDVYDKNTKIILYCEYLNMTFLAINDIAWFQLIMKFSQRLGFVKVLSLEEDTYDKELLVKMFDNQYFDNRSQLDTMINVFKNTMKSIESGDLEYKVKHYMQMSYNITESEEDCVDSKILYKNLFNYLEIKKENFISLKNKLGKILLKLGYIKKRKEDGIYYTCLVQKKVNCLEETTSIEVNESNNMLHALIDNRAEIIKYFFPTPEA